MSAEAAPELIRSIVDRILRLKAEQDERAADIRDVYKEAKGHGLDKTALGRLVAHLRKIEKGDDTSEADAIFAIYLGAYENAPHAYGRADIPSLREIKSALENSRNTNSEAA